MENSISGVVISEDDGSGESVVCVEKKAHVTYARWRGAGDWYGATWAVGPCTCWITRAVIGGGAALALQAFLVDNKSRKLELEVMEGDIGKPVTKLQYQEEGEDRPLPEGYGLQHRKAITRV